MMNQFCTRHETWIKSSQSSPSVKEQKIFSIFAKIMLGLFSLLHGVYSVRSRCFRNNIATDASSIKNERKMMPRRCRITSDCIFEFSLIYFRFIRIAWMSSAFRLRLRALSLVAFTEDSLQSPTSPSALWLSFPSDRAARDIRLWLLLILQCEVSASGCDRWYLVLVIALTKSTRLHFCFFRPLWSVMHGSSTTI